MQGRIVCALVVLVAVAALAGCGARDTSSSTAVATDTAGASAVPFDRAFIDGMVPHHEEAIAMANEAKAAGLAQPDLVELADSIIAGQQEEADQMRDWRQQWFGSRDVDPMGAESLGMSDSEMGMGHEAAAFGSADDVDATFAEMMIAHHKGAIAMAELAAERGQHQEIKDLAADIVSVQTREIAIMEPHASGGHQGMSMEK